MGFQGISTERSTRQRSATFPVGFRGVVIESPVNVRYIKVTDWQGFVLSNVEVTVNNTAGPVTSITNQQGFCEIIPDVATNITIDLKQYQTVKKGIPYNTNVQGISETLILEPYAYLK